MISPKITDTRVVIGPCRLSYVHLVDRYNPDQAPDGGRYTATVLIPKEEAETIAAIKSGIENAKAKSMPKWGGRIPAKLDSPLRDGDQEEAEGYAGQYFLRAKSKSRPGCVDRNNNPLTTDEELYSGMWAYVSLSFFGYDKSGNRGVGVGLNNIRKYKDDTRFGGGASAESDFSFIGNDVDDADL